MARAARRVLAEVGVDSRCAALAADLALLACPANDLRLPRRPFSADPRRCPASAWRSTSATAWRWRSPTPRSAGAGPA